MLDQFKSTEDFAPKFSTLIHHLDIKHGLKKSASNAVDFFQRCSWSRNRIIDAVENFGWSILYDGEVMTLSDETEVQKLDILISIIAYYANKMAPDTVTINNPSASNPYFDSLPVAPILRVRRFIRDLAWGVWYGHWENQFYLEDVTIITTPLFTMPNDNNLAFYFLTAWGNQLPAVNLIEQYGFFDKVQDMGGNKILVRLSTRALDLAIQSIPTSIFISYARRESSALALLIVARLKEHNMSPYLDMHPDRESEATKLNSGESWEEQLKTAVQSRDNLIVLVGPETVKSQYVRNEIKWALEADHEIRILPVWHNGFTIDNDHPLPEDMEQEIAEVLSRNHAIIVEGENPKQYNAALDELLAYFGIAP